MEKGIFNAAGTINLLTGHNEYFNPLEEWGDGFEWYACLFRKGNKYRMICGCGKYDTGEGVELVYSQSHRTIGIWECVQVEPGGKEGFARIASRVASKRVLFGTWD